MPVPDATIIEINNEQSALEVDGDKLRVAIRLILDAHSIKSAVVSLALVTDAQIHRLNRQWLSHDEPTDVLSFLIEQSDGHLEGDVIVSTETAIQRAHEGGWDAGDELLLYVVHGVLHLVGYDDLEPDARELMRARESEFLAKFELSPNFSGVPSNASGVREQRGA